MHRAILLIALAALAASQCPSTLKSCGQACFDPSQYCCNNSVLIQKAFCKDNVPPTPQPGPGPQPDPSPTPQPKPSKGVVFFDDFKEFDLDTWQHEITAGGGGNWEFQYYTNNRSNSYVRDGILYLKPTLTAETVGEANLMKDFTLSLWGGSPADLCTSNAFYGCERAAGGGGNVLNPIQSARLRTVESFSIKQPCTVEIRAKLPRGDWIWPALWMLPKRNAYGSWPASGEIDIMESRGNAAGYASGGVNAFGSTLHWGPYTTANRYPMTHKDYTLSSGDFTQNFHTFGLQWTETGLFTYLDDPKNVILNVPFNQTFWQRGKFPSGTDNPWVGRGNAAPFDQEFYILMNVAVGGVSGYFPDSDGGGKPWSDKKGSAANDFWGAKNQWYSTWQGENAAMQVDWVKVTKL